MKRNWDRDLCRAGLLVLLLHFTAVQGKETGSPDMELLEYLAGMEQTQEGQWIDPLESENWEEQKYGKNQETPTGNESKDEQ